MHKKNRWHARILATAGTLLAGFCGSKPRQQSRCTYVSCCGYFAWFVKKQAPCLLGEWVRCGGKHLQCYKRPPTFPSRLSCCISCSLLPMPMNAHGWASCSVQPSFSILSTFFFQPLPIRYTHGGGQKNLHFTSRSQKNHTKGFQCKISPSNCHILKVCSFEQSHTNLFSFPYDFCATFACSMRTVWSSFPFK